MPPLRRLPPNPSGVMPPQSNRSKSGGSSGRSGNSSLRTKPGEMFSSDTLSLSLPVGSAGSQGSTQNGSPQANSYPHWLTGHPPYHHSSGNSPSNLPRLFKEPHSPSNDIWITSGPPPILAGLKMQTFEPNTGVSLANSNNIAATPLPSSKNDQNHGHNGASDESKQ